MYPTRVAAGHNGPTVFLLKGKNRKSGFNDTFLKKEGCELGSTICMTKNAYMTEEAWEEMTPSIVKGYRVLPVVKDNPQWWMIEIFDGFGAHHTNLNSLKQRAEAKILSIKEEGDSSSFNQAYNKHVAKSDKHHKRRSLKKRSSNLIVQWDLIHCGVAAVRYTHCNPEVWISSFVSVNLRPMRMIPFADWCKKLEPFMQAADSFNLITQSQEIDEYTLLPALWQAMSPVVDIHGWILSQLR